MVKEVMAAEGITANKENKTTRVVAASVCTGVTNASTTGTVAKAMAKMNARETVVEEQKKWATAQQAASTLHSQVEEMKRVQLQMFMSTWNNNGFFLCNRCHPSHDLQRWSSRLQDND